MTVDVDRVEAVAAAIARAVSKTRAPRIDATIDAASTAAFAASRSAGSSNARLVMNRDTVNPIPARAPVPMSSRQVNSGGSDATRMRTANHVAPTTPTSFPTTSPTVTPAATATAPGASQDISAERYPGVGESEQRDDEEAGDGMQQVREPVRRRHGLLRDRCEFLELRRRRLVGHVRRPSPNDRGRGERSRRVSGVRRRHRRWWRARRS